MKGFQLPRVVRLALDEVEVVYVYLEVLALVDVFDVGQVQAVLLGAVGCQPAQFLLRQRGKSLLGTKNGEDLLVDAGLALVEDDEHIRDDASLLEGESLADRPREADQDDVLVRLVLVVPLEALPDLLDDELVPSEPELFERGFDVLDLADLLVAG